MREYCVSGPHAFRGHEPGTTFEANPKDPAISRAVDRGSISETAKKAEHSGTAATPAKPEKE